MYRLVSMELCLTPFSYTQISEKVTGRFFEKEVFFVQPCCNVASKNENVCRAKISLVGAGLYSFLLGFTQFLLSGSETPRVPDLMLFCALFTRRGGVAVVFPQFRLGLQSKCGRGLSFRFRAGPVASVDPVFLVCLRVPVPRLTFTAVVCTQLQFRHP